MWSGCIWNLVSGLKAKIDNDVWSKGIKGPILDSLACANRSAPRPGAWKASVGAKGCRQALSYSWQYSRPPAWQNSRRTDRGKAAAEVEAAECCCVAAGREAAAADDNEEDLANVGAAAAAIAALAAAALSKSCHIARQRESRRRERKPDDEVTGHDEVIGHDEVTGHGHGVWTNINRH